MNDIILSKFQLSRVESLWVQISIWFYKIVSLLYASVDTSPTLESRTKLDSHVSMVFLGGNWFLFDGFHGRTFDVDPLDPSIGTSKKVPMVDTAFAYTWPYTHDTYVLISRNALYTTSMDNNLIPTFIIWESGFHVRETTKMHFPDPESRDHALTFPDSDIWIPPSLWGIFSFFHTRIPTSDDIQLNLGLFLTPDSISCNRYSEQYASQDNSMVYW